jgi:hypothetical protein
MMTKKRLLLSAAFVGAILLLATGGGILVPAQAAQENKIRATGDVSFAAVTPDIATQTQGSLLFRTFYITVIWTGTLNGKATSLSTITRDASSPTNPGTATALGTFRGTVGDSDPGIFSFIVSYIADRSACGSGCPPGTIKFDATFTVVEGSGMNGLAGICGGGTWNSLSSTSAGTYDFTFRFGNDCKANNN